MAEPFVAQTADRSYTITLPLPLEKAMPFFEPEGERAWADGWDPRYLAPSDGHTAEGMVFTTRHGGHETIWIMTRDRRSEGKVEYVRMTPGHVVALVSVDAREENASTTRVTVRYRYTALSDEGNAYVDAMDEQRFATMISGWQSSIRRLLAH